MQATPRIGLFPRVAFVTALLTLGLIVFGAVVRVTDSGLGCGEHWPLCNGTIFPPLDNTIAWIEWLHRLFAAVIGLFGLGMLALAIRAYRQQNRRVLNMTIVAAVLFTLQSALGALVVVWSLPPTMVTLHLGTAMLLLGALLISGVFATYRPRIHYGVDRVTTLVYLTTALSLVIILTGALVRGSGSSFACSDWPLCNGEVLPLNQGRWALIHMLHRYSVLALGISLLILVYYVYRDRQDGRLRTVAVCALIGYFSQAAIGAFYVLRPGEALWGAAHVGMAATTWALLVALSGMEWLSNQSSVQEAAKSSAAWNPQSSPTP